MTQQNPDPASLDRAVADRLSKLAAMPVDTGRLDSPLAAVIPRLPEQPRARRVRRLVLRPITAMAASITIVLIVAAALLMTSGGQVLASPAQMAQVHRDIVANRVPVTHVDSIEEASRALSESWSGSPTLPQPPQTHVMACCMKSIHDKKVACVLLRSAGGTPITMSVARSRDMRLPPGGPTVTRDGVTYHVQSIDSLNMVMTERAGRWVCLIAELPQDQLIEIASRLKF